MGNNQDAKVTASLLPDERYRLLYEASRDTIWLIRLDGSIAEVNQAAVSSYGYSREELLKMNLRELRHASQQALLEDHLAQAQEGGIRFETVHVRKDGSSFPAEVNASSVRLGEETFILGVVRDITGRKASETKLRALQQTTQAQLDELKTLLELLPIGVWAGNEDCSTIVGNTAAYAMLGLASGINASLTSAQPELPEGLRLFVNGLEIAGDDLPMQQVARTGRHLKNFEHEILYPDGTVKTILANIAPVLDDTGKVRKVIGAYTDYSERKRMERQRAFLDDLALELSHTTKAEDIMQRVGEKIGSYLNVPYCHFMAIDEVKDEVIYLARWNRAGVTRLPNKVKLSEQISEDFRKLAHAGETVVSNDTSKNPITKGEANAAINAVAFITVPFLKGGEWTYQFSVHDIKPRVWRDDEIQLVRDLANRTFPRLEQAMVEEALRESEQKYRVLTELSAHMVWTLTPEGDITYLNKRWFEYTGMSEAEIKGGGWIAALHPDDRERITQEFRQALARDNDYAVELRFRSKDDSYRWHLSRARPIKEANRTLYWLGVTFDIHERKRAEERLEALARVTASFAQSQTLAEVLQVILNEVLAALGSNGGGLRLVTKEGLVLEEHVRGTHASEATVRQYSYLPFDAQHPACEVVHRGEAMFLKNPDDIIGRYPNLAETVSKIKLRASAHLPLKRGEETFGVLSLSFSQTQTWTKEEQQFALTLADRTAVAYERARLFEEEQRARKQAEETSQRLASLQAVTGHLATALTPADIVKVVLEEGLASLGAKAGTIAVPEGQDMKLLGAQGYSKEVIGHYQRFPVESDVPLAEAFRTQTPLWLRSVQDFVERYHRAPSVTDYQAWATVPLKVNQQVLGGLGLAYSEPQRFDESERSFILTLANLCAQALERARLFEENKFIAKMPAENPNPVLRIALDGHVLYANDAAQPLLAFWQRQHQQAIPDELRTLIQEAFESTNKKVTEIPYDERTLAFTLAPILEAGYVNLYGTDITERKKLELELREADKRKDEFLATLGHELRNPLSPIRTSLEIMKRTKDESVQQEARETIERQTSQMVHLIDDLLDVSRITRGKIKLKKERVVLTDIIKMAAESSEALIEDRNHTLTVALPPKPVVLLGDKTRLSQIVLNLLTNAAKYTPLGGTIKLSARLEGSEVVITLEDNGIGIPEAMLDKVFEMFTRVERQESYQQQGLGIGLSLVKQLVGLHGGSIAVSSLGEGKGSTFTVRLPIIIEEAKPEPRRLPRAATQEPNTRRVLVVDDYEPNLKTMSRMLKLMGHDVATAANGPETLECLEAFKPEIILLDINMPGMSGYEVARRVREHPDHASIKLVAVTGYGQDEDVQRAKAAGFDEHLVKPVDMGKLAQVLRMQNA